MLPVSPAPLLNTWPTVWRGRGDLNRNSALQQQARRAKARFDTCIAHCCCCTEFQSQVAVMGLPLQLSPEEVSLAAAAGEQGRQNPQQQQQQQQSLPSAAVQYTARLQRPMARPSTETLQLVGCAAAAYRTVPTGCRPYCTTSAFTAAQHNAAGMVVVGRPILWFLSC